MDSRVEVREFLRSRRGRVSPESVNFPAGPKRRVPGLRREEVALLAGVSVDYYAKLERGDLSGVSDEVLDAIVRTLRLDDAESSHLYDLARAAQPRPIRRSKPDDAGQARPNLQRFLDTITGSAAWVRDERMDFIATNDLARALYSPIFDQPQRPANNARFVFLHEEASRAFYPDWETGADSIVATLRTYAGRRPHDKGLTDIIGELATRSEPFRRRWASRDVTLHINGVKLIDHPFVGRVELDFETMQMPANPDWTFYSYTAAPGSPSAERLALLGSWDASARPSARIDATGR